MNLTVNINGKKTSVEMPDVKTADEFIIEATKAVRGIPALESLFATEPPLCTHLIQYFPARSLVVVS